MITVKFAAYHNTRLQDFPFYGNEKQEKEKRLAPSTTTTNSGLFPLLSWM